MVGRAVLLQAEDVESEAGTLSEVTEASRNVAEAEEADDGDC